VTRSRYANWRHGLSGRLNWAGIEGFRLLRVIGRPTPAAAHSTNLPFENTSALVTVGAYRWVRHPLYASLLAMVWCAYLKSPFAICSLLLALAASCFFLLTALVEERENLARFWCGLRGLHEEHAAICPLLY